jgi:hypothetical protein
VGLYKIEVYTIGQHFISQGFSVGQVADRFVPQEHPDYSPFNTPALPSRVLEISEAEFATSNRHCDVRSHTLKNSATAYARYACLSHCWGDKSRPPELTQENISSLKKNIPGEDISSTIVAYERNADTPIFTVQALHNIKRAPPIDPGFDQHIAF